MKPHARTRIVSLCSPPTVVRQERDLVVPNHITPQWMKSLEYRYRKLHDKIYSYGERPGDSIRQNLKLTKSNNSSSQLGAQKRITITPGIEFVSLSKDKYQNRSYGTEMGDGIVDVVGRVVCGRGDAGGVGGGVGLDGGDTGSKGHQQSKGGNAVTRRVGGTCDKYSNTRSRYRNRTTSDRPPTNLGVKPVEKQSTLNIKPVDSKRLLVSKSEIHTAALKQRDDSNNNCDINNLDLNQNNILDQSCTCVGLDMTEPIPKPNSVNIYSQYDFSGAIRGDIQNNPVEQKQPRLFSQMSMEAQRAVATTPELDEKLLEDNDTIDSDVVATLPGRNATISARDTRESATKPSANHNGHLITSKMTNATQIKSTYKQRFKSNISHINTPTSDGRESHDFRGSSDQLHFHSCLPGIAESRTKSPDVQNFLSESGGLTVSPKNHRLASHSLAREKEKTFEITPLDYDIRYRIPIRCEESGFSHEIHNRAYMKCMDWLTKYNPRPETPGS